MGKVFCMTHGPQHGPQCCSHVLAAIDASSEAQASVEPDGLVSLSLDLLDDRQIVLSVLLCRACAMQYGRTDGEVIAGNEGCAPAVLPWTCPSCGVCLERWMRHSTVR